MKRRRQLLTTLSVAFFVFWGSYLAEAFYSTNSVYTSAVKVSEAHAHTIVGKEGYEYIFEPSTQILIDRVKPNGARIVPYLVFQDYFLFKRRSNCSYPDAFVCNWILIQMNPNLYQPIQPWKQALSALVISLLSATGIYLLTSWRSDAVLVT